MGTSKRNVGGNLGVTLLWTSVPSRGSRYTPSHFISYRDQSNLWLDGPLGSYIHALLLLYSYYIIVSTYVIFNYLYTLHQLIEIVSTENLGV